jgi:hypothetical protein
MVTTILCVIGAFVALMILPRITITVAAYMFNPLAGIVVGFLAFLTWVLS